MYDIILNFILEKYWSINSILMGLYDKKYWLAIWKDAAGRVDEKQQLRNAAGIKPSISGIGIGSVR